MANKDFMDPELTEEEKRETILANEDDYLEGLLAAADNAANDTKKIEIIRNERKYFSFSIHSLTDEMLKDIRKKYTKYTKNRRQGIRVADELDMPKYRASVIYNSTTEEDKANILMPLRIIALGSSPFMLSPSNSISPSAILSRPAIISQSSF